MFYIVIIAKIKSKKQALGSFFGQAYPVSLFYKCIPALIATVVIIIVANLSLKARFVVDLMSVI